MLSASQLSAARLSVIADSSFGPPPHSVSFRASIKPETEKLDFRNFKLEPYYEDVKPVQTTVEKNGTQLHLVGNTSKMIKLPKPYKVTPSTILEFDFCSLGQGEVHAIGFDNDNGISGEQLFTLFGSEPWGIAQNFHRNYYSAAKMGQWVHYRISVGEAYQGEFKYLVFMNDHDVANPNASSQFTNVSIFEMRDKPEDYDVSWDLGDGSPKQEGWRIKNTYKKVGVYKVTATAREKASGKQTTATLGVSVRQPRDVQRTLFIDDMDIESVRNIKRVVNRALKHPYPVLKGDKPWDAYRPQVYGDVLYDPKTNLLRMWYLSIPDHILSGNPAPMVDGIARVGYVTLVAYAESKNGLDWIKPNLGVMTFNGSRKNSLVNIGRDNPEGVSIIHEPHDKDPKRRYKAMFWEHSVEPEGASVGRERIHSDPRGTGMWVAFSADGIHWENYEQNPVIPQGSDSGQCVLFDKKLGKYILFSRVNVGRRISRAVSDDFINWSNAELVFAADEKDPPGTQVYGSGFTIYEGHYVGFPWMFYGDDQKIDVQFIHSRDGIKWHRTPGRERIIPNGPEGAWDSGIIFTACHPVVTGEKIYIYYFGMQGDHFGHPKRDWEECKKYYRGSIGVATLRRDGWISMDIPLSGGHVITRPVTIPPIPENDITPRFMINTNAYTGDVEVSLLDEQGKEIAGFERSVALHGDFLGTEVTWPGHQLSELVGRKVKVKISGRLAKLYSFWIE